MNDGDQGDEQGNKAKKLNLLFLKEPYIHIVTLWNNCHIIAPARKYVSVKNKPFVRFMFPGSPTTDESGQFHYLQSRLSLILWFINQLLFHQCLLKHDGRVHQKLFKIL